jgi:hypothetical protein
VKTICLRILLLGAALAFISPAIRSEQSRKPWQPTQEDRIKKLEERADATEKASSNAAMEKDYITRSQKLDESYSQKTLNTQMWTLAIMVFMGLVLTAVFVLIARFSLNTIEERTKIATAEATAQMRNEYARTFAKELQKLWDSNAADIRKLKETVTAQVAELEQNVNANSYFQIQFLQGLAAASDERAGDPVATFRNALSTYESGKPRKIIETKFGATTVRYVFESLQKRHGDNYVEKAREELAGPIYNGLEEELALAALHIPWLTPLINERISATPEPAAPAPTAESRLAAPPAETFHAAHDLSANEESDSCRLIER